MPGRSDHIVELASPNARRWPLALAPLPGEQISSWLRALARDMDRPPYAVARLLGIKVSTSSDAVHGLLAGLRDTDLAAAQSATGLCAQRIKAMTLADLIEVLAGDEPLSPFAAIRMKHTLLRGYGSNFCPQCLRDNGGRHLVSWLIPWIFVCLEHEVFPGQRLVRGRAINHDYDRHEPDEPCPAADPDTAICAFRHQDWPTAPVIDRRLVEIQRAIVRGLDRLDLRTVVDEAGTTLLQFLTVTHLVILNAPAPLIAEVLAAASLIAALLLADGFDAAVGYLLSGAPHRVVSARRLGLYPAHQSPGALVPLLE